MKSPLRLFPLLLLSLFLFLAACDWLLPSDDEAPSILIDNPTTYFSWVTTDETIDLAGTALDNEDLKSVKVTVNGGNSVTADGTSNWTADNIPLDLGSNVLICEAKDKGGNTAKDTLFVTRNTDVEFSGVPYFSISNFFAQTTGSPVVRQAISVSAKAITSVKLVRLSADLGVEEELGELFDNGNLYNSDEIFGDGVYSGNIPITEPVAGKFYYSIVAYSGAKVANYSPMHIVNVYEPITQEEVSNIVQNHANLASVLNETTANTLEEGASELQAWFLNQPDVASVAEVDGHLEITYDSGIKGGVIFSQTDEYGKITTLGGGVTSRSAIPSIPLSKQTRGSNPFSALNNSSWNAPKEEDEDAVQDKDVLIWQPYQNVLAYGYQPELDAIFAESDLGLSVTNMSNAQCTIASLANLTEYGTVIFMTHGVGGQHILTGEAMTSANVWEYLPRIISGELGFFENISYNVVGGFTQTGTVYSVTHNYISNLSGTFPNSIIYNGSCEGSKTAFLGNAFAAKGAKAYLAFSKIVGAGFAKAKCLEYFQSMAVDLDDNVDAFISGQTDPDYEHATFTMSGNDDLHYSYDLINGDFEFGNINGWTRSGDGRAITQLAGIMPTQETFMGIISTGLGYSEASGSLAQPFLVPQAVSTLGLKWNFISEEFMEWVGSQYQDYLTFALVDEGGTEHTLFHETIDSFVGYGLDNVSPPVYFDHGGCYGTGWRTFTSDITAYRGQIVRLILRIGDVGDSAYDSACLLDEVSIY